MLHEKSHNVLVYLLIDSNILHTSEIQMNIY